MLLKSRGILFVWFWQEDFFHEEFFFINAFQYFYRHSLLTQMLPEAMVAYLENHGPEKFAQIFLGEYDTPEAIWSHEMRTFMIQKIAYHLADFTPRLKSNVRALYQYCPIPMISYPRLESELFCDIYYLRNLCNDSKFPDWPILNPLKLLKEGNILV